MTGFDELATEPAAEPAKWDGSGPLSVSFFLGTVCRVRDRVMARAR